jgi:hypothetical protein
MATLHISQVEVASDFAGLIAHSGLQVSPKIF